MSWVVLLALLLGIRAPGSSRVELPEPLTLRNAGLIDIDADGRRDLVLAVYAPGRRRTREFRAHLCLEDGSTFASEPDLRFGLTSDVIAVAVADVASDPGRELLLLSARGVFLLRPGASEESEGVELLFEHDLFWSIPDVDEMLDASSAVKDLDGDGLDDLVLPEEGGWRVAMQRRTKAGTSFELSSLRLPHDPLREQALVRFGSRDTQSPGSVHAEGSEGGLRIGLQAGSPIEQQTRLASASISLPALLPRDYDGDGDLDLMAFTGREILLWIQSEGGKWSREPNSTLPAPVQRDEERGFQFNFTAEAEDFDGDRRVDVLFFAADTRSKESRTQVLFYDQAKAPLFGDEGMASSLVIVPGLAGPPELVDLDGDGDLDLVVATFRPDALDAVRSASSGRIDLELRAHRNRAGRFRTKPDLQAALSVKVAEEDSDFFLHFLGDENGDGLADLLVRDSARRLEVRALRASGDEWKLEGAPFAVRALEEKARLYISEPDADRRVQVLAFDEHSAELLELP
jgi:hypothetical protein